MKWTFNEAQTGDMVRVCLGDVYHYGIYVSDDEIIQFGPPPTTILRKDEDIEVCVTGIEDFLLGKFLEVAEFDRKEKKTARPANEVIEIARSRIGEKGYSILYNNCEHFVHECVFGVKYCSQTENIRNFWRTKLKGNM